jgi:Rieske Fe-S protein
MTDVREELARYCAALDVTQPRVDLEAIVSSETMRANRGRRGVAAILALLAVLVGVGSTAVILRMRRSVGVAASATHWHVRGVVADSALRDIPFGVSVLEFGTTPTFVVREGDSVRVFLTNVQDLPGEDTLWWCPQENVFAAPTHGEVFAQDGEALGGPAQRGLNELYVQVSAGRVTAHLDQIRLGTPRDRSRQYRTSDGAWDSGPGSFCTHALKNARINASPPTSRADAIQIVSRLNAEIEPGAVYAAKLTTNAAYNAALLPEQRRPPNPRPQGLLWLVAVHGRLHPSFGGGPTRTYAWGIYTVDATDGAITGVRMANAPPLSWTTQPDLDR